MQRIRIQQDNEEERLTFETPKMKALRMKDKGKSCSKYMVQTDDEQALMVKGFGTESAELNFAACAASWDDPVT